ncbi:TetR/AcrR family transcriptional regulator [Novosphingobium sp. BL-8H]|uniref:TetR/AcrR family transcriptional regulator n=1 Tax=Novosphingobium sp. BL-8H TaxID=3127640 RepID=UPI003756AD6D
MIGRGSRSSTPVVPSPILRRFLRSRAVLSVAVFRLFEIALRSDDIQVYTVYMDTRSQILDAAWRHFEADGEAGVSLRKIAGDVGITPMAIYRHFANRQALIDALVAEAIGEWRLRVGQIGERSALDWIKAIGEAYLTYAIEAPARFDAAFLTYSETSLKYPDDFLAGGSPAVSLQMRLIAEFVGAARAGDIMVTIVALGQGLVSLYRAGRVAGDEEGFKLLYRKTMHHYVESFAQEVTP